MTEAEAKAFARSKLEEGLTVYAGTINPHTPKRLVPSSQIYVWLADENAAQRVNSWRRSTLMHGLVHKDCV